MQFLMQHAYKLVGSTNPRMTEEMYQYQSWARTSVDMGSVQQDLTEIFKQRWYRAQERIFGPNLDQYEPFLAKFFTRYGIQGPGDLTLTLYMKLDFRNAYHDAFMALSDQSKKKTDEFSASTHVDVPTLGLVGRIKQYLGLQS